MSFGGGFGEQWHNNIKLKQCKEKSADEWGNGSTEGSSPTAVCPEQVGNQIIFHGKPHTAALSTKRLLLKWITWIEFPEIVEVPVQTGVVSSKNVELPFVANLTQTSQWSSHYRYTRTRCIWRIRVSYRLNDSCVLLERAVLWGYSASSWSLCRTLWSCCSKSHCWSGKDQSGLPSLQKQTSLSLWWWLSGSLSIELENPERKRNVTRALGFKGQQTKGYKCSTHLFILELLSCILTIIHDFTANCKNGHKNPVVQTYSTTYCKILGSLQVPT